MFGCMHSNFLEKGSKKSRGTQDRWINEEVELRPDGEAPKKATDYQSRDSQFGTCMEYKVLTKPGSKMK